jgi:uncharacterized membrane protein YoaK (UPF0700 family)
LAIEALILAGAAFIDVPFQLEAIAFAMGIQNSSLEKFADVKPNTSFITGNYTRLAEAASHWLFGRGGKKERDTIAVLAPLVVAYGVGAACAAAAIAAQIPHSLLIVVPIVAAVAYLQSRGDNAPC